jgi:hypothetical protein
MLIFFQNCPLFSLKMLIVVYLSKIYIQCKMFTDYKNLMKYTILFMFWICWQFNLAIRDLPEVLAEAKRALCGEVVTARLPLCVEISLRTVEGDTMMLETWCLGVLPEQCDPSVRVTYTVYNRMGILLKSLVSVTRVTPAYKLSRHQGPDSYVICYRIYMGEPQLHSLGKIKCYDRG